MANQLHSQLSILIDLDGVVYQGGEFIDGARQTLQWIEQQKIPHLFVTNTTSRPRKALLDKLEKLGYSASTADIMTPAIAANEWLSQRAMHRIALFLPPATWRDFEDVEVVPDDCESLVDAVVIGDLGDAWDFRLLNSAFRMLMREPAPRLVALGMTRYWRGSGGLQLDVAPFVKALEHASGSDAVVVGKPARAFFDAALARLGCVAADTLMIGDDIVGDIDAAQRCGIRGVQVRTGKFRAVDLERGIDPYAVLDSFADLPDWWSRFAAGEYRP